MLQWSSSSYKFSTLYFLIVDHLVSQYFSSPHLLEVRERIRINGHPLTKYQFVEHFWDCYKKLEQTKVLFTYI